MQFGTLKMMLAQQQRTETDLQVSDLSKRNCKQWIGRLEERGISGIFRLTRHIKEKLLL